jgi:inorganic pyrophosphatase
MESLRFSQWRPHPWHGLPTGRKPPIFVNAYIEITPFDLIKYEVDKESGYLRVDRPQRTSSQTPALYGFVPRTYCGERVKSLCPGALRGDGDPLDICVISERPIDHSEIIVPARVVGGLELLDRGEADDKIIAVLENDLIWGGAEDITELPEILIERLRHYFSTYKLVSGQDPPIVIQQTYGRDKATHVIDAAMQDYADLISKAANATDSGPWPTPTGEIADG